MQIFGKTTTVLPAVAAEAGQIEQRMSKYGDAFTVTTLDTMEAAAIEGSMFIARPTPAAGGTGTAMGIQTAFSDTANIAFMISNGDAAKTILPQYIRMRITAAGTTTTSAEAAIEVDSTNRFSSGGSTMTPGNVNPVSGAPTSNATVRMGAITAAAAGARRAWLWSRLIRQATAPAWIVGDVVDFVFGSLGDGAIGYSKFTQPNDTTASPGTTYTFPVPQAAVPPGGSMLLHIANVANATTPPSMEWEACWMER